MSSLKINEIKRNKRTQEKKANFIMNRMSWYVNSTMWNEDIRASRNLILTVGWEIERNSREKVDIFFLVVEKLEESFAGNGTRKLIRERKEEKCILVRPSLSLTKAFSYVPQQVVLPHWFTGPFVSFLEFLAKTTYRMDYKYLRIAARWFKELRD